MNFWLCGEGVILDDMKYFVFFFLSFLFYSCSDSDKSIIQTFKKLDNGDSILQLKFEVSSDELNGFYKVYYDNGVQKVESIYQDGLLDEIVFVHDRNGNPLKYGKLINGTGCVKLFFDDTAIVKMAGCIVKGEFSGKWSNYNYKGELTGYDFYNMGRLKGNDNFDFSYYH